MAEESKEQDPQERLPATVEEEKEPAPADQEPLAEADPTGGEEPPIAEADDGSMSLIAHLTELRARIIKCLIAITIGSGVGYYFIEDIMHYLTRPVGKLYYMQPAEAFFTYIKIAVVVGFLLALPVIFYHVCGSFCLRSHVQSA